MAKIKQVAKMVFQKDTVARQYERDMILKHLNNPEVEVVLLDQGSMSDETEFLSIKIRNIKP